MITGGTNIYGRFVATLRLCLTVVAVLCLATAAPAMAAGKKIALIIGNSNYVNGLRLPNPQNDARLVAQTAMRAGFEVTQISDVAVVGFHQALKEFRSKADNSEVAMVYYAGHGIDNNGENWLIPTDALLSDPRDLSQEAIRLSEVLDTVAGAKLRVILLDACRNSPFADKWTSLRRDIQPGLRRVDAAEGSLVIFATEPGTTILDEGSGGNSYFAKAISDRLAEPGLSLQLLGNKIYDDVLKQSGGKQRPTTAQRLPGMEYYLVAKPDEAGLGMGADDVAYFKAQQTGTAQAYLNYVKQFPQGKSVQTALQIINALSGPGGIRPASPAQEVPPQQAGYVSPAGPPAVVGPTYQAPAGPPASAPVVTAAPQGYTLPPAPPVSGPIVFNPASQAQPSQAPLVLPPPAAPMVPSAAAILPQGSSQSATYVAPPISRQYGNGGFPIMPEPPQFSMGPYPTCKDDWLAVTDNMAKVNATNLCKSKFVDYFKNWLNKYREAMNSYGQLVSGIYTNEVAQQFRDREAEKRQFYDETVRRVKGVDDHGILMGDYERAVAQYNVDMAAVEETYYTATGCHGHPLPAGLAPNPACK